MGASRLPPRGEGSLLPEVKVKGTQSVRRALPAERIRCPSPPLLPGRRRGSLRASCACAGARESRIPGRSSPCPRSPNRSPSAPGVPGAVWPRGLGLQAQASGASGQGKPKGSPEHREPSGPHWPRESWASRRMDFRLQASGFGLQLQTSNSRLQVSTLEFRFQTSNFKLQTSSFNFGVQSSDFKLQTSSFNFGVQASNFKFQLWASDSRPQVSALGFRPGLKPGPLPQESLIPRGESTSPGVPGSSGGKEAPGSRSPLGRIL